MGKAVCIRWFNICKHLAQNTENTSIQILGGVIIIIGLDLYNNCNIADNIDDFWKLY